MSKHKETDCRVPFCGECLNRIKAAKKWADELAGSGQQAHPPQNTPTPNISDNSGLEELEKDIHKLFGDSQAEDGGYFSCYDGKWLDMTNEVTAVARFVQDHSNKRIEAERLRARINELDYVDGAATCVYASGGIMAEMTVAERREQLEAELKAMLETEEK